MSKLPSQFDPNGTEAEGIRTWMQAGLDGYLKRDMGRWAFRPLERYVDVRYDLAEDLRAIYQDVEPHAQVRWRTAIRDLLAMQGCDQSKREATRVLIDFAALIRAHEVLDVLPALVSSDPESLLDQVVGMVVALANQTDRARTCLEYIHTSPSFSPDYAGLVLVALCRADPDGWLRHVEDLAKPMNVLASQLEADSTALRSFARRILDAVSLSRLDFASLNRLERSSESIWLWKEWLGSPDSLLRYEAKSGSTPRLFLRTDNAQSIVLDEPLEVFAAADEVRRWLLDLMERSKVLQPQAPNPWRQSRHHIVAESSLAYFGAVLRSQVRINPASFPPHRQRTIHRSTRSTRILADDEVPRFPCPISELQSENKAKRVA